MKKFKYIWEVINSPFIIACIVFGLTTYLGNIYQQRSWKEKRELEQIRQDYEWHREKNFQLLSYKLREGQKSLEEIADTITARLLQSRKVFEILTPHYSEKFIKARWADYMVSVNEWNQKLIVHHNKLERLVSSEVAQELLFYNIDGATPELTCLHDEFVHFHEELLKLKRLHAQNPNTESFRNEQELVTQLLGELNSHIHLYLNRISSLFIKKESDLLSPISKTRVQ